jgi:WD40 repeat protein
MAGEEIPWNKQTQALLEHYAMKHHTTYVFILMASALLLSSCDKTPARVPRESIAWDGPKGFLEWGPSARGLFGVSTDNALTEWLWDGQSLQRRPDVPVPRIIGTVPLPGDRYIAFRNLIPRSDWPLAIAESKTNNVIKRWVAPEGWAYATGISFTRPSGNGKYLPVFMNVDPIDGPYRIGVVDLVAQDLRFGVEFAESKTGEVREVAVSDDGRLVALGGWGNGVLMGDMAGGKVLWRGKPRKSVSLGYVAFSPDGNTVFAADTGLGHVYALDANTGNLLRAWDVSQSGASRMSCLAVSPDGAWVAAGSGPGGRVFLMNTGSPNAPIMLPHGLGTTLIVSFSLDSKHLASVAGGKIKIWDVTP